ncbi:MULTISPECIES: hypothetical protein [unclassified Moraxella]|uniref:hypothetical protein n=1 Tax=unclassified Moraxella TaxID=2685852 RepID=UPI003AF64AB4
MSLQENLIKLESINNDTSSKIIDEVYDSLFKEIAHDHSGIYYDDKIWVLDDLIKIYDESEPNSKRAKLIFALLNNIAYFNPQSGSQETHQHTLEKLHNFLDEEN